MRIELVTSLSDIDESAWDLLAGDEDPFVEHHFLKALEDSGSVGRGTGWQPLHVTLWDAQRLIAALPLYIKGHSYGEYIFDWAWASAAHRAGIEYYPKLVSMAPLTPATGQRVLVHPEHELEEVVPTLLAGVFAAADEVEASSVHLLFLTRAERDVLVKDRRLQPRLSMQYHWDNPGYATFEDYVARFRSAQRKQLRKERKRAARSGLAIDVVAGPDLSESDWAALRRFYFDTCYKRGSGPYLTEDFFGRFTGERGKRVVAVLARDGDRVVAGTLNFRKGNRLYGRYWGCIEEHDALHFECCYYRLIEYAIQHGLSHFEAGAQGLHKLRRGLMPVPIHSAHWIAHPGLSEAIGEYLPREALSVQEEIRELADHGPFHRG